MNKNLSEEATQAWIQLHHAHRHLLEKVEKALKDAVLPPLGWYDVLLELYREKPAGLRQYEISEKILLSKHNLSRLIDRLAKNKLVTRHTCEEDGRGTKIRITDEGVKIMKKIWPVYSRSIQENFETKLTPSEFVTLQQMLKKVLV
ncbi:MAG: MarR family transcriptional regulator [Gammaproteobacteria bacterium]|nr:MarR family transcriptional regulator [Gammaproteobacteria bacterium]